MHTAKNILLFILTGFFLLLLSPGTTAQPIALGGSLYGTLTQSEHPNQGPFLHFTRGISAQAMRFQGRHFFYSLGLNYQRKGIFVKNEAHEILLTNEFGEKEWKRVGSRDLDVYFHSLLLPVNLNYKVFNRQGSNLFLSAGARIEYLFVTAFRSNSTYNRLSKSSIGGSKINDPFGIALELGLGWYQPVGKGFLLLVKPFGYQYVNRLDNTLVAKEQQNNLYLGLSAGLFYTLPVKNKNNQATTAQ